MIIFMHVKYNRLKGNGDSFCPVSRFIVDLCTKAIYYIMNFSINYTGYEYLNTVMILEEE